MDSLNFEVWFGLICALGEESRSGAVYSEVLSVYSVHSSVNSLQNSEQTVHSKMHNLLHTVTSIQCSVQCTV